MAATAIGEAAVVEHCTQPAARVVAVRALSRIMVRRGAGSMARYAVGEAGMVEYCTGPGGSRMAL